MGGHASLALNALWKLKIALQWLNCSSVNSIVLAVLNTPFSTPSFFHSLSSFHTSTPGALSTSGKAVMNFRPSVSVTYVR